MMVLNPVKWTGQINRHRHPHASSSVPDQDAIHRSSRLLSTPSHLTSAHLTSADHFDKRSLMISEILAYIGGNSTINLTALLRQNHYMQFKRWRSKASWSWITLIGLCPVLGECRILLLTQIYIYGWWAVASFPLRWQQWDLVNEISLKQPYLNGYGSLQRPIQSRPVPFGQGWLA